jgi:hypothetical protein
MAVMRRRTIEAPSSKPGVARTFQQKERSAPEGMPSSGSPQPGGADAGTGSPIGSPCSSTRVAATLAASVPPSSFVML